VLKRAILALILVLVAAFPAWAGALKDAPATLREAYAAEGEAGGTISLARGDKFTIRFCINNGESCLLAAPEVLVPGAILTVEGGKTAAEAEQAYWDELVAADALKQQQASKSRDIVAWGDSLTKGSGAKPGGSYPEQIQLRSTRRVSNQGIGGESAQAIFNRMQASPELNKNIVVIWAGRNDVNGGNPLAIVRRIEDMVGLTDGDRYLVLSVTNGALEPAGSKNHSTIMAVNQRLAELYGPRFVDVRTALVTAAGFAEGDATTTDVPPRSVLFDDIHLNDAGYAIVADVVLRKIDEMGW
jgi:lysophospholipase L1-like esterase